MEWVLALLAGGGASFAAWKLGARRAVRREHAEELEGVRGEHSGGTAGTDHFGIDGGGDVEFGGGGF